MTSLNQSEQTVTRDGAAGERGMEIQEPRLSQCERFGEVNADGFLTRPTRVDIDFVVTQAFS